MAFQRVFTPCLVASLTISFVICRWTRARLPYWVFASLTIFLLFFFYAVLLAHTIVIRPLTSSLRHVPKAPQISVWRRLFKEPSAYHFEKWFREVPNDGLIRYYGILNIERVLVTSPVYTRQILQTDAYSYEKQYGQRTHLERVGGRGLVWQEGKMHKYLRKALEPAFKTSLNKIAYFAPVAQKTEEMLRLLREILNSESVPSKSDIQGGHPFSAVIELDEVIHRTVFDIMGLVAFGPDLDFQSIFKPELYYNPLKDYRLAFKPSPSNRLRVYCAFFLPTWAVNMLPIKFNLTTALAIHRFRQIGQSWIERQKSSATSTEKRSSTGNTSSFIMESIIRDGKLSDSDLLEQFSMLQAGGIHSTGAAMMSALWWLAHPSNSTIQERLRAELRMHIPSHDPRTWVSSRVFDSCHYLNAVISEVLRLHPPFSWLGRTPNRWMEVGGTALPPGLSVSLSPWATHRDPVIWGPDANEFRPERWLQQQSPDASGSVAPPSLAPSGLLSFGAGPRKCIAEPLARMELQCVLAALFRQYRFEAVPGVDMPGVTHQSTLAFRSELRLRVSLLEGWDS